MKTAALIFALTTITASAQEITIGYIPSDFPQIIGSQCEFRDRDGIVMKSDWINKYWLKIDGKLVELTAKSAASDSKKWRGVLHQKKMVIKFSLDQESTGEDSATYKGHILVNRGGLEKRIEVTGGCGA